MELVAAIGVTGFAFVYERHAHLRSFDISLRGRADTVMGAVEDADDSKLGVMLDTTDLKLPRHDLYAVREEGGKLLGQSANWSPSVSDWTGDPGTFTATINGRSFRGIRLHGVRVVDPMSGNVRHPLTVLYASPTHELWEAIFGAVQVFALANGLLLLLTALFVPLLIRRSMSPLHTLATEAGGISARSWHFSPGDDVRRVGELRPLVDAMEGVIRRLERSFTQQQQFVGDAAHELKTAVAVVKSSVQLLELRSRTPAEYEAGLRICYADCLRMEDLAQKMLLMARVEETEAVPEDSRTPTCLSAGIQAALAELAPFAELREVTLLFGDLPVVAVGMTPEMLRSLLVNLLTNAVQHSPPGATVRVGVRKDGNTVQLRIEDQGEGIPAEALPFVFDRFYRGDPSRSRKTGGTGLGLAICKAIVEQAQGTIDIESSSAGTTVIVGLPAVTEISSSSRIPSASLQALG